MPLLDFFNAHDHVIILCCAKDGPLRMSLVHTSDCKLCFHMHQLDHSDILEQEQEWFQLHGNKSELLPTDAPESLGMFVTLMHCVDADLMHDITTEHHVTPCPHFVNEILMNWHSKKQVVVKNATCGSEFVAARTCVDQIVDLCATLHCLGVKVNKSCIFADIESIVNSLTLVHTKLHK